MLNHPTTHPKSTWENLDQTKHIPLHWGKKLNGSSTISKAIFNEPLPLSIYQNGIRTALRDEGEGRCENGGTWQKEKVFIKDSEVEVGGEEEGEKREEERLK